MNIKKFAITALVALVGLVGGTQAASAAGTWGVSIKTTNGYEWCTGAYCSSSNASFAFTPPSPGYVDIRGPNAPTNVREQVSAFNGNYTTNSHGFDLALSGLSVTHKNGSAADVTIAVTYSGLTFTQARSLTDTLTASISGTTGVNAATISGSVTVTGGSLSHAVAFGSTNLGQGATSATLTSGAALTAAGTYSVTLTLNVHFRAGTNGATVTFGNLTSVVPEPGSLALLGFGLLAAGFAFRKRFKQIV